MKIKLGIIDRNKHFIDKFEAYIAINYAHEFDVLGFSMVERYTEYNNRYKIDVLLVEADLYDEVKDSSGISILLTTGIIPEQLSHVYAINKYQSGEIMINEILRIYYSQNKNISIKNNSRKTKLISFYSPIGGSGKTTLALIFSKLAAKSGIKTLYINTEIFSDTRKILGNNNEFDITYLLCELADNKKLEYEINKIKCVDEDSSLDYINSAFRYEDITEIHEEMWGAFINKLADETNYDYVIVDMETDLNHKMIKVMEESSKTILIGSRGYTEGIKFNNFYQQILSNIEEYKDISEDKFMFILNNARNISSNNYIKDIDTVLALEVYYDNAFKYVDNGILKFKLESKIAYQMNELLSIINKEVDLSKDI